MPRTALVGPPELKSQAPKGQGGVTQGRAGTVEDHNRE
jgi:hypothetical protein